MRVPMSSPSIGPAEQQAVAEVLATPVLSMGEQTTAFEEAVRHFSGAKHAISVNSGTAGLHLCVRAAGIGPGDLVLTTPFSFVSSSNVMLFEQAVPVFVDVDPRTGNLDPQVVAQAAADLSAGGAAAQRWLPRRSVQGGQLKAILAVDIFGQPADFTSIRQTADQYGLPLIEDSCEALGAEYRGQLAGRLGDMGVYAFYPNKQITTGEGGVIITDDDQAADFMRALRNQGRAPGDTWLQHTHLGYNYRITELSAALGRVQMGRLEELLRRREQVAAWYQARLQHQPGVELQYVAPDTTRMSWFVYAVRVAPGVDRDQLVQRLLEARIPSRPYFAPIHLQPFMIERFGYQAGDFPITEDLGNRGLAIPFSGVMTEEEVDIVCQELARALA
ncbi:MAG: DegT/DnrJ/EryC1/StrS family aminotransferase [Anaerolineales bacterium]|nr:DegT/DnrJ/EryC1/StrS family aminotransferase [Anaerolineales bacterium]